MQLNNNLLINNIQTISDKEYIQVCKSGDLTEGIGKKIELSTDSGDDIEIALFRVKGKLFAVSNICPHNQYNRIYYGMIHNFNVTCPVHGWRFSLVTGEKIGSIKGKGLEKFNVIEKDGVIYIEKPHEKQPKWMTGNENEQGLGF